MDISHQLSNLIKSSRKINIDIKGVYGPERYDIIQPIINLQRYNVYILTDRSYVKFWRKLYGKFHVFTSKSKLIMNLELSGNMYNIHTLIISDCFPDKVLNISVDHYAYKCQCEFGCDYINKNMNIVKIHTGNSGEYSIVSNNKIYYDTIIEFDYKAMCILHFDCSTLKFMSYFIDSTYPATLLQNDYMSYIFKVPIEIRKSRLEEIKDNVCNICALSRQKLCIIKCCHGCLCYSCFFKISNSNVNKCPFCRSDISNKAATDINMKEIFYEFRLYTKLTSMLEGNVLICGSNEQINYINKIFNMLTTNYEDAINNNINNNIQFVSSNNYKNYNNNKILMINKHTINEKLNYIYTSNYIDSNISYNNIDTVLYLNEFRGEIGAFNSLTIAKDDYFNCLNANITIYCLKNLIPGVV